MGVFPRSRFGRVVHFIFTYTSFARFSTTPCVGCLFNSRNLGFAFSSNPFDAFLASEAIPSTFFRLAFSSFTFSRQVGTRLAKQCPCAFFASFSNSWRANHFFQQ